MNAALAAAETRAVEARRVADAYAEQVQRRRARWQTVTANAADEDTAGTVIDRAWTDYQHAIAQFRSAKQTARAAESFLTNVLEENRYDR